jgi:hypothetical protein
VIINKLTIICELNEWTGLLASLKKFYYSHEAIKDRLLKHREDNQVSKLQELIRVKKKIKHFLQ